MKTSLIAKAATIATLSLAAVACAAPAEMQRPVPPIAQVGITHVEGSVSYRERMLMPAGSTMTVRVQDVSRADARADTIAEISYTLDGSGPPYGYRMRVMNDRIDPQHTYAVRAEIHDPRGRLVYTTDQRHEVLTRGASNEAHLVLVRVNQ